MPDRPAVDRLGGVAATVESLKALLETGDPNIVGKQAWVPHRPPRPDKSEGGVKFEIASDFEPRGDQPAAIDELVAQHPHYAARKPRGDVGQGASRPDTGAVDLAAILRAGAR